MITGFEGLAAPPNPPYQYVQDPSELIDYVMDWTIGDGWVLPEGDTIASVTYTSEPGLTLSQISFTGTTTTVWVSGGQCGYLYKVVCTITTVGGRIVDRKLLFGIKPT